MFFFVFVELKLNNLNLQSWIVVGLIVLNIKCKYVNVLCNVIHLYCQFVGATVCTKLIHNVWYMLYMLCF